MKRLITIATALLLVITYSFAGDLQWKADWISKEHTNGQANTWMAFRKTATLDKVPEHVTACIAADSKYWLWINGEQVVFEGGLKRGPAPGDTYYDKLDIAKYLRVGDNDIAVLVWYFGKMGFSHMSSGTVGLLFQAEGDGVEILSDSSWKATTQSAYGTVPGYEPNYRLPESCIRYDARKFKFDWFRDPSVWMGAAMALGIEPGKAPFGRLVERPIPLWKDYGIKEYEEVTRAGDTLKCRLPYNCQVTPLLKVDSPEGRVITMMTDHADVDGTPCLIAQYVTREGVQEYESLGWLNGEYMYYVVPQDVKVLELKYRQTGYDTEFAGSFHCDDEFLNDYWSKAARTLYVCMRDTYYDCPDRERAQWWGDEVNELGEAFYILSGSSSALARKGILELAAWQKRDGVMFAPVPASNWSRELPMQTLASIGWYGFRRYCFYSGDYSVVPEVYDNVHRYLHEVWQLDEKGLPRYRSGGWDWPDGVGDYDAEALLHCWYALALKAEREFADYLGLRGDVAEIDARFAALAASFNQIYWNGSVYRTPGHDGPDDDRVQALSILAGLADSSKYPSLAESLKREFHASTYMTPFVLEALFRIGEADAAIARMHRVYPSVMKASCSTLYEHWDYTGSSNHAWTGGGAIALGQFVSGIEPLKPGFTEFTLNPQLGPLHRVEASVPTPQGVIDVTLTRKSARSLRCRIVVPAGSVLVLPGDRRYAEGTYDLTLR